ncbi:small ribosomal subunit protein uS9m-like [Sycon ciliatum]|uniref:small ribosomal subunit protein uS9m-like n=1 Tax=Sycon ciliatum TaxID=27933 RepID=UPI0020A94196|eukprot:scpid72800/ scgid22928/ 28S ribosomal protein S9, mitochondrial
MQRMAALLSSAAKPALESLARPCAARHAIALRCFGGGRADSKYEEQGGSMNDIIDGHVGELTMKTFLYEHGKYPLLGHVQKNDFDRLVRGAEHRNRVHQPPMTYGDSEGLWLQREVAMWEDGRIRLAEMMSIDPETFTEEDITKSLAYLLPSQLWEKDTRPRMLHPMRLYPEKLEADMDLHATPKSAGFYTGSAGFNELLYSIYQQAERMQRKMASAGFRELMEEFNQRTEDSYIWKKKSEMESALRDPLSDEQYDMVIERLDKLANHKLSYVASKFLKQWSNPHVKKKVVDDNSRTQQGQRMECRAWASVRPGTGKLFIRERPQIRAGLLKALDIAIYWPDLAHRQIVLHPFIATNSIGLFDAEIEVLRHGNGCDMASPTVAAGATRLALSRALAVINPEYKEILEKENLLTQDERSAQRKQPGRLTARKIGQWKKR